MTGFLFTHIPNNNGSYWAMNDDDDDESRLYMNYKQETKTVIIFWLFLKKTKNSVRQKQFFFLWIYWPCILDRKFHFQRLQLIQIFQLDPKITINKNYYLVKKKHITSCFSEKQVPWFTIFLEKQWTLKSNSIIKLTK